MYAALCADPQKVDSALLFSLALQFSPGVEQTASHLVVFPIDPLRRLIGSPHQIASEISRAGYEWKIEASLAIASNPDSAILLARMFPGVTLVTPGEESLHLTPVLLADLFAHVQINEPGLLDTMRRWGLKTCGDLAGLPEKGVAERLGKRGIWLRNLAAGRLDRPLQLPGAATTYEEGLELEHSLELLEPLLFLLGRVLGELCERLRSQSQAARILEARLELEGGERYRCELEFPVPLQDSRTILKLLQLHLERHSQTAAVTAFTLRVEPAEPKRLQGEIFLPPAPSPDKLQVTLARIAGLVGKENVGTPVLLNTHRPDAFEMRPLPGLESDPSQKGLAEAQPAATLRLAMRLFRPALPARVRLVEQAPRDVAASGVKGTVQQWAGPWKTSGEWWAPTCWRREEWDVALDDGALYRIYQVQSGGWYVHGVYD